MGAGRNTPACMPWPRLVGCDRRRTDLDQARRQWPDSRRHTTRLFQQPAGAVGRAAGLRLQVELADHVDVVGIDEIGNGPAIEVVLGETLIREVAIGFREADGVVGGEYLGTDGFVIAAMI